MPKGCWSLQNVVNRRLYIRNNVWKGHLAFHDVGTKNHCSVYIGDGLKNDNFCFLY